MVYKAGRPVGYLGFSVEKTCLYVQDVQLVEACRGAGLGAWIMARVVLMARTRQCESIRLKVFKSNSAAVLYRRLGYQCVGEKRRLSGWSLPWLSDRFGRISRELPGTSMTALSAISTFFGEASYE